MSINVTVNGNPISLRRGKMVLSDLENIRKSEREQRKRLRLEQVQEQSRALSKKLLERARQIEQEQLNRLEQDGNTEMKRERSRRLMELHRRYQDTENIGYAHENATKQPDIESIRLMEGQKNRAQAKARGTEAVQRLQDANKVVSPRSKQQERLRQAREIENQRSSMVSKLPKNPTVDCDVMVEPHKQENVRTTPATVKKRAKCVVSKKTPVKKIPKQAKVHGTQTKTPSRISVSLHEKDASGTPTASCADKTKVDDRNSVPNYTTTVSGTFPRGTSVVSIHQSDDDEPRKSVPVTSSGSGKLNTFSRCHDKKLQDSSSDLSSTLSVSSSSISEDSSYFSDNQSKTETTKKTSKTHTSPVSSKITMYDYGTRQKKAYDRPSGLVERINVENQPNAEDMAQEILESRSQESALLANQRENSRQRTQDALLREKTRSDYRALMEKLEQLSKEERKLRASQISGAGDQLRPPCKTNEESLKKQKRMDRAFQNILRSSRDLGLEQQMERPITITPRDYIHSKPTPNPIWREPPYISRQGSVESLSEEDVEFIRKRRIPELLSKIEQMKRRLLEEYGADLPDDVFHASVNSLFNQSSTSGNQEKGNRNPPKTITPEPRVVNTSDNEAAQPVRRTPSKIKKNTVPARTISRHTPKPKVVTRDQQVQVEMEQKQSGEAKAHPIEPIVTIITPENADSISSCSSNSSSATDVVIGVGKQEITVEHPDRDKSARSSKDASKTTRYTVAKTPVKISFEKKDGMAYEVAGLLIDPEKKEITVLPKKKKSSELPAQKESLIISGQCHSLPGSRAGSPSKKSSRSAPSSRHSSPKKPPQQQQHRSQEKRGGSEKQAYRTQYTQVSIDSSTESSQMNSTSDTMGNSKFFARFHTKQVFSKRQDTSDTSTTYASPPMATAGALLNAMNSSTPILELLDSSTNERYRQKSSQVSPVSSPETPSPRTMKLPSNMPRPGRVSKSLKFMSVINTQSTNTPEASSLTSRGTRTSLQSTSARQRQSEAGSFAGTTSQTRACTCRNPGCKLFHDQIEDTHSYALLHCPKILKRYEDLQNVCTERIASLTDLIEKVRNEQKGLELSMATQEDSNSACQLIPNSQSSVSGDELVKNIEAIHAQLKRTLMDSQKLISGEGIAIAKSATDHDNAKKSSSSKGSPNAPEVLSASSHQTKVSSPTSPRGRTKPRIVNNERVNIRLDRFRVPQITEATTRTAAGAQTAEVSTASALLNGPEQNDEMVEKLSQEILEQSKSINKSVPNDDFKNSDNPLPQPSQEDVNEPEEASKEDTSVAENDQSVNLEMSNPNFVPLLAGIPKIPRIKSSATNSRSRPPVTLISGPYRPEIVSPVHELSTIVEFDTPDTINKSQISARSPSNRCRKKLVASEATQSTSSSPSKKTDAKLPKSKPSVHVAPLPAHRSPQLSFNTSSKSTARIADKSPKKSQDKSLEFFDKKHASLIEAKISASEDSMHSLPDVIIEQLQQSQDNTDGNHDFRISQISEMQSLPDENIDQMLISEIYDESKSKSDTPGQKQDVDQAVNEEHKQENDKGPLSSTSSTSISCLSGVSEITSTPSSNSFKCPSSPEEMGLALKKLGLAWAFTTLKKTREASALGSSSSSDVTPVNIGNRLISPVKKAQQQQQDGSTAHDLPEISDVSSISIKHANKSTEKSVLVKGRTSTPNRLTNNSNNSDGTISTLGSFSSDLNIVVQNESADITIPNISFSNNKLA
ncbi:hypothetical protein QAD02_015559 [Eretmocerus hayati]|uniref:Uncharacterized protein n=1 Tax=Eretmocerus hayati TaxID=131215 RepID=A0ACC2P8L3_9HYME|nr:hypothetical protein QAD02_015559 [Eretmocerus hayati]